MNVFISWSKEPSRAVARRLAEFLDLVFGTDVSVNISLAWESGAVWQSELSQQLSECDYGVICVTRANQTSPYLNFEAGAIAKKIADSRCVPLAIDLEPSEITRPLGAFQARVADRDGLWSLVVDLGGQLDAPEKDDRLRKRFDAFVGPLLDEIVSAKAGAEQREGEIPHRSLEDMVGEVLTTVRALASRAAPSLSPEPPTPRARQKRALLQRVEGVLRDARLDFVRTVQFGTSEGKGGEVDLVVHINGKPTTVLEVLGSENPSEKLVSAAVRFVERAVADLGVENGFVVVRDGFAYESVPDCLEFSQLEALVRHVWS